MNSKTLDIYQKHLFDNEADLRRWLPADRVDRMLRVRDLYMQVLGNPTQPDRATAVEHQNKWNTSHTQAYEDLRIVKSLIPMISDATRDFHRFRYNEMILETYQRAKEEEDLKTMERAASSYARFNRVEEEDLQAVPYDQIVIQPFTATNDPSVLGIKPMKNLRSRIDYLLKKYGADNPDIEDIEAEQPDL